MAGAVPLFDEVPPRAGEPDLHLFADRFEKRREVETVEPFDLGGEAEVTTVSDPRELMETSDGVEIDESDASLAETQPDELFDAPSTDLSKAEADDGTEKA